MPDLLTCTCIQILKCGDEMEATRLRCGWCGDDPLYLEYHDTEWGVPLHDDRKIFEFLQLEMFQAGLSWITILRKREAFRRAFDGFNPEAISSFSGSDIDRLMHDAAIIRNRKKLEASVKNANAYLSVRDEFGSFDRYIWRFVGGRQIDNAFKSLRSIPPRSAESEKMSLDLRSRGFSFLGPVICYAHMQATGMVNDHIVGCFRHSECLAEGNSKYKVQLRKGR